MSNRWGEPSWMNRSITGRRQVAQPRQRRSRVDDVMYQAWMDRSRDLSTEQLVRQAQGPGYRIAGADQMSRPQLMHAMALAYIQREDPPES